MIYSLLFADVLLITLFETFSSIKTALINAFYALDLKNIFYAGIKDIIKDIDLRNFLKSAFYNKPLKLSFMFLYTQKNNLINYVYSHNVLN